ncbi:MAG: NAD(P)H-dependent oxidoreductase [Bacteroidetes bacterium]|nr:NAD(P)H-dependent oxidoreductase [Bacteroidota bacterium]
MTYAQEGRNGDIEKILFHINHGMLYFTGMDVVPPFIAYSVARLAAEEREHQLENYKKYLLDFNQHKPIGF